MAEEKMQAAKVLLKNPYRQVILQDYNKTLESHKFRKKAEEIENELSWFTGKSSQYRVEDRHVADQILAAGLGQFLSKNAEDRTLLSYQR